VRVRHGGTRTDCTLLLHPTPCQKPMNDLNLLVQLEALLSEGSVVGAAGRLGLSPSAMSRALARLREATGDPLLVRAGRGLVPTPRALELRDQVSRLVQDAEAVLRPAAAVDIGRLERTFTLRVSEGFTETFGPALIRRVAAEAPGVRLRFLQKVERSGASLRDGIVDLETGVIGKATRPELLTRALFRDRWVGVARAGHSLSQAEITLPAYASERHIAISRGGVDGGPADVALQRVGAERTVAVMVGGFSAALSLARSSDLVATVPERHTAGLREGMLSFPLPFDTPTLTVSMLWHPRMHADPAHRWLRERVRAACA
jgi:DNA-binding transcriptional LysR family regulator